MTDDPALTPDPDTPAPFSGARLPDGTPVYPAIRCRCCDGYLNTSASIAARIGPVCAERERAERQRAALEIPLFDLPTPNSP